METAQLLTQVGRAVSRAHEAGIVHRDLKPSNIFLVRNDDETVVKVLDFGVAKTQNELGGTLTPTTRAGAVLGTPYYMSPEQIEGFVVDHRADVWALGVIAFECLTGQLPFVGETLPRLALAVCERPHPLPSDVAPVPPGFDAWFLRATARELTRRFDSAKRAIAEFRALWGAPQGATMTEWEDAAGSTQRERPQDSTLTSSGPALPARSSPGIFVASTTAISSSFSAASAVAQSSDYSARARLRWPTWAVPVLAIFVVAVVVAAWSHQRRRGEPTRPSGEPDHRAAAGAPTSPETHHSVDVALPGLPEAKPALASPHSSQGLPDSATPPLATRTARSSASPQPLGKSVTAGLTAASTAKAVTTPTPTPGSRRPSPPVDLAF